jgi:hypothetical protein
VQVVSTAAVHAELPELQETEFVYFKEGYRYQTTRWVIVKTKIATGELICTEWFILLPDGWLLARPGYAWDGASGPAINTLNWRLPSLCHDVLCQAIAMGRLSALWADEVHAEMHRLLLKKHMNPVRAWYSREAVEIAWVPSMSSKEEMKA